MNAITPSSGMRSCSSDCPAPGSGESPRRRSRPRGPADVNAPYEASEEGITPLIRAAGLGYLEMSRVLIEFGADVRARTSKGRSALTAAAERGYQDLVLLLLNHDADGDIPPRPPR